MVCGRIFTVKSCNTQLMLRPDKKKLVLHSVFSEIQFYFEKNVNGFRSPHFFIQELRIYSIIIFLLLYSLNLVDQLKCLLPWVH